MEADYGFILMTGPVFRDKPPPRSVLSMLPDKMTTKCHFFFFLPFRKGFPLLTPPQCCKT